MIYIGIDPGRKTGIAVWSANEKKFLSLMTTDFWGCIKLISNYLLSEFELTVVLENPNLNRPVFFPKAEKFSQLTKLKKAQDVGRNKEDAFLIQKYCESREIRCIEVRPTMSKWTHETFINLTKADLKRSNEHVRDAARLIWGL